jgi:hypothetical protein
MLPHRTGVYQNHIRLIQRIGLSEAVLFQRRANHCRIKLVHLAAEGFYQYFFIHIFDVSDYNQKS